MQISKFFEPSGFFARKMHQKRDFSLPWVGWLSVYIFEWGFRAICVPLVASMFLIAFVIAQGFLPEWAAWWTWGDYFYDY